MKNKVFCVLEFSSAACVSSTLNLQDDVVGIINLRKLDISIKTKLGPTACIREHESIVSRELGIPHPSIWHVFRDFYFSSYILIQVLLENNKLKSVKFCHEILA